MRSHTLCAAGLLCAASAAFAAISPLDVTTLKGPTALIVDSATKSQVGLAPLFTRVNSIVQNGLAQHTVLQAFRNPLSHSTEIGYVFPLPEDGSVHAMSYQSQGKIYRAKIQEKARAQTIYDSIRNQGGQAALLLQERPNIFQQSMANVRPSDTVWVEIKVSTPLHYADGTWEMTFPTMVGERCCNPGTTPIAGTLRGWNPPADRDGPTFQFNILTSKDLEVDSIWSPTHPLTVLDPSTNRGLLGRSGLADSTAALDPSVGKAIVLADRTTYPNQDFVLRLRRAGTGIDIVSASWKPYGADTGYVHLNVLPDLAKDSSAPSSLDLVILVDRSGSQSGWPMDREKELAKGILDRLTISDRFTVIGFDDYTEYANGSAPVPATAQNLSTAKTFVDGLYARGGTSLRAAIQTALSVPLDADRHRLYVFLTDGFITDDAGILEDIAKASPVPQILTFGCGGSLNRDFLERAAANGNGFATLLTQTESASNAVSKAWDRVSTPQVENLSVSIEGASAHDWVLPVSKRLYKGLPLVMDAKYLQGGTRTVKIQGTRRGATWKMERDISLAQESSLAWAVPKVWARAAIGWLDNDQGTRDTWKDSIIALSSGYQVLSKYTAFLATEGTPVEPGQSLSTPIPISSLLREQQATRPHGLAKGIDIRHRAGKTLFSWENLGQATSLRILDLEGRMIAKFRSDRPLGHVEWNGTNRAGLRVRTGTYVAELVTSSRTIRQMFALTH